MAGGWYHVTGRGNERRAVFRDERDRELAGRMAEVEDRLSKLRLRGCDPSAVLSLLQSPIHLNQHHLGFTGQRLSLAI